MVLEYYGRKCSEAELAILCELDPVLGTTDTAIANAARAFGFEVEVENLSNFDQIGKWLRRGVPPIVDWITCGRLENNESDVPDGHYSVVVGLDLDFIYLQDPEIGKLRKIKKADFLRVWFDFNGDHLSSYEDLIIRQLIAVYKETSPVEWN